MTIECELAKIDEISSPDRLVGLATTMFGMVVEANERSLENERTTRSESVDRKGWGRIAPGRYCQRVRPGR